MRQAVGVKGENTAVYKVVHEDVRTRRQHPDCPPDELREIYSTTLGTT